MGCLLLSIRLAKKQNPAPSKCWVFCCAGAAEIGDLHRRALCLARLGGVLPRVGQEFGIVSQEFGQLGSFAVFTRFARRLIHRMGAACRVSDQRIADATILAGMLAGRALS